MIQNSTAVRKSFTFAQDDRGIVVPNEVRDLLKEGTAKSWEVLRFRLTVLSSRTK
ncbi:hypothetical protein [Legionella maceachernii]|uniref:hypothetical protein n=1 Tax=Legionella maceachernii TaxID=466 RepID=UPI001358B38F|nr:hypothetical protein [Legionella maceachernii]